MTTLEEKASSSSDADIDLVRQSAPGLYKLVTKELTAADEIGTDSFPEYGDFLWVETARDQGQYIEVPADLARQIVSLNEDDWFRVVSVTKDVEGQWVLDVDTDPDGLPADAE